MTDKQFYTLISDAVNVDDRSAFVSDWATSSIWGDDPEADIPAGRAEQIGSVWDLAHISIREIRKSTGLSQANFALRFCIPKRTLEDWEAVRRECPLYTRLLLARACGIASDVF